MEAKLHSLVTKPPLPTTLTKHSTTAKYPTLLPSRHRPPLKFSPISSSSSSNNANESSVSESDNLPRPQITPPPETVEVRFRRRSRRRSNQQRDDKKGDRRLAKAEQAPVQKKWEDMNVAEKAMALYVGEKGLLFWLNKFAYASIFIVIGGWIFFRFVGPSLNLYQLDSPPLSPDSMFKGSS